MIGANGAIGKRVEEDEGVEENGEGENGGNGDASQPYPIVLILPMLEASFLCYLWFVRRFSQSWIAVGVTLPSLIDRLAKRRFTYWLALIGFLFILATATWGGCSITNKAQRQNAFCSSVQHSPVDRPYIYTQSLLGDLIETSTRSADITSQAFE